MIASRDHVLAWLALVERRVVDAVQRRRALDPAPDDPFRGLYVTDDDVDRLLMDDAAPGFEPVAGDDVASLIRPAVGESLRLPRLTRDAGLSDLDVVLLMLALAPDLDPRFERLYGYLNDDVTRRRASVGLALELAGSSPLDAIARGRFDLGGPLVERGLLRVDDPDRPLLTRALRVPDRVAAHLLGDDRPDAELTPFLTAVGAFSTSLSDLLGTAVRSGVGLVHLREHGAGTAMGVAVAALAAGGRPAVVLDLDRAPDRTDPQAVVAVAQREALLRGAGVVAGPVEAWAESAPAPLRMLAASEAPVLLVGTSSWNPVWSSTSPLLVDVPAVGVRERVQLWERALAGRSDALDLSALAGHLALGPEQIRRAVDAAGASARLTGRPISAEDLRLGVRAQNAAGLERLARRIEPEVSWDDLVLAPAVGRGLRDLADRARHRDLVLGDWRMRQGGGRGHGVTALFAGDSGTGKTMSAEVIAADLGLDLYTVNLATVVDKYIGETEKNLERIFAEAGGVNAVLFFDEADAIFGKRSDVRDAHDRYANIESAYLLQRLETFDGLAVLATNLRANIDDAFTRRLDAIIDFPAPTPDLRRTLWRQCLAPPLPVDADIDVDFLASSFELAGGNIRSAATTAAYLAAALGNSVTMQEVVTAVEQEYRKLGRLVLEREFGSYYSSLR